ncbi:MAG: pilin glycosylation ligase domain-containing protein, partial [Natronospirillum sp.]
MSFNNAVPPVEANALSRPSPQHRRALYFLCGLGALYGLGVHLTLPNVGGIGLVLPSNIFTWLFFALPLGIGLYHAADQGYLKFSTTTVWLALAAVLLTVPVLYPHAAPRDAVTRLVGLWAGWLFLVLLQQFTFTSAHRAWLLKLIVLGVTVQALLGYGQYLLFNADNWLHYLVAPHRPVGVFQQPNVMASFLATGLAISAYWLLHPVTSRVQLWRLRGFSQAIDRRYLLLCIPVTTLPLLVVLSSRTGWLAVLVLVLLMLPYALRRESRGLVLGWLLSVLLGVGAGFALAQVGGDTERVAAKATTADPARQDLYQQAWDMFTEQPWVGHGLGRFESAYVAFGARQQALDAEYPSILPNSSHPHNEILFWLAEGGVLALLGLLVVGAVAVRLVWRQPPGLRTAGLMLLLPIALHSQLEHPFYLSTVHWLTLIMVLAYLDGSGPWR